MTEDTQVVEESIETKAVEELATSETKPEVEAADASESEDISLLKAKISNLNKQVNSLVSHNEKILGEKKVEQTKRQAAEEEKLKKAGEWKQLHDSQEKEKLVAIDELTKFKSQMGEKIIYNKCLEVAATIADKFNIEHIAKDMVEHIRLSGDDLRVVDSASGELTVQTLEEFAQTNYVANPKWASLVRGNQSKGGSATGSGSSATGAKEMKRSDWDQLDVVAQRKFIVQDKGTLV